MSGELGIEEMLSAEETCKKWYEAYFLHISSSRHSSSVLLGEEHLSTGARKSVFHVLSRKLCKAVVAAGRKTFILILL